MEELDLKQLFEIFWSRKIYVALIVLIFVLIGFVYTYFFVDPVYKSEAKLLLVKQETSADAKNAGITTTDLTLNQKLVSTYSELIKSPLVLKDVIVNLGIDMTEADLKNQITVTTSKDTEIIIIRVVNENAQTAQIFTSEIVKVFSEKVKEIYKIDNITVVGEAEIDNVPYNINHVKDIIMFSFVGLVIASAYVFVANMLDTTVKSKDDLEKKLKISVLTEIPLCDFNNDIRLSGKKGGKR